MFAPLAGLLIASSALAQGNVPPSYGYTFVTVGAPGNRAMLPSEGSYPNPNGALRNTGAVNYEYRISRTETTANQWLEFVNAYWPYFRADGGSQWDARFTSNGVEPGNYSSPPPADPGFFSFGNIGASMSWRMAARYCNWLHNGKALTREAFESGAYDTSTFGQDAFFNYTDQRTHSPGAKYWIPTLDEWVKATYYDVNRYGPGLDGYWQYAGSSATPLTPGPPGVGQTNAGTGNTYNVASYPNVQSPWGLLDTSGGTEEWTELKGAGILGRLTRGSSRDRFGTYDAVDSPGSWGGPYSTLAGLRLASAVPTPGSAAPLALVGVIASRRRRLHLRPARR